MYVCMYIYMYLCMYVSMNVCMYDDDEYVDVDDGYDEDECWWVWWWWWECW